MTNKDIKNKLIYLASKQEVSNLNKEIISGVDTSKVIIREEKKPRRLKVLPYSMAGLLTASLAVAVGIGIGSTFGHNSTNNNVSPVFDDVSDMKTFIEGSQAQDYKNIINIASVLDDMQYTTAEKSKAGKNMTQSEENALVIDVNSYMPVLEDMFNLVSGVASPSIIENSSNEYNLYYDVIVPTKLNEYHIYFNETKLVEKNLNETNYRLESSINGYVVVGSFEYEFYGTRNINNGTSTYTTRLNKDEDEYFVISEEFKVNENEFTYEAYQNDTLKKHFEVTENLDDDGNTTSVYFRKVLDTSAGTFEWNKLTFKKDSTYYLVGNIKSKNSDVLYITYDGSSYTYKFENSLNEY